MNVTSLSASMVNTYRQCPYKFYCSYCLKLPRRGNAFMAFGSAFHAMAEENWYQKRQTHTDLPIDLLTDFFAGELEDSDDVDWKEQEQTLDQTKDQGVKTVRAYQQKVAPGIQPKLVEHLWSMEIKNRDWVITGKTDLIDSNDLVIDLKTTGRLPAKPRNGSAPKPKPEHRFQLSTYAMAWKAQTGKEVSGRLDYALRGTDKMMSLDVALENTQSIVSTFDNVATSIIKEWWPIFRSHYLCSRKYCDFVSECEKDCGGEVKK